MRKLAIAACVAAAGCTGRSGSVDSAAAAPDSTIVAGPAAVPSQLTPPADSAAPRGGTDLQAPATGTTPPATGAAATVDSVRGIVSVVGTSFEKRVMIAATAPTRRLEVIGALAGVIGRVAGAEVTVSGRMTGTQLDASGFVVRAVDGQPAIDGTLRVEGGDTYIVTAAGVRSRIVAPPPPLQGRAGARVWITGDPARGISSFGFIDPPR